MIIGMFLVKELVNALGGGGVSFFFGTNEEIHCKEKGTTKDPTKGECHQAFKDT